MKATDIEAGDAIAIKRVEVPTREAFKTEFASVNRPIIITGAMRGWKALGSWHADYLNSKIGEKTVQVSVSPDGFFSGDPKVGFVNRLQPMKVSNFIDLISSPIPTQNRYYLQQKSIPETFPELISDIEVPIYIENSQLRAMNLWFGPGGNTSPLHYDNSHNLLAQIYGRKRITLFPPTDLFRLYPFSVHSRLPYVSRVNVDQPDFGRFPRFKDVKPMNCVLEAGEILFIPVFWWHQVYSIEMTISVNFWWGSPSRRPWLSWAGLRHFYAGLYYYCQYQLYASLKRSLTSRRSQSKLRAYRSSRSN